MKVTNAFSLAAVIPTLVTGFSSYPSLVQKSSSSLRMSDSTSSGPQVTVIGGTGFVGSRVCKLLVEQGAKVTSVSKTGTVPKFFEGEDWTSQVNWVATDILTAESSSLDEAIGSPEAIVSCLGVIGTDPVELKKGNGNANVAAFESAKRGGNVERSAFVSVASEVMACQENWLPEFFGGYFDGKRMAEAAAVETVNGEASKCCLVKPSFIYGGDSFGLLPPRVNTEYGSFIEELLSLPPIQILAGITPGLIKVALRAPSSVDAVAAACSSAAMGGGDCLGKTLDGTKAINEATNQPDATGLTDVLDIVKEKAGQAYDWAKVNVPKAIDAAKEKLDEAKTK